LPIHLDTEYSAAGWILAYPFGYRIFGSWVDTCLFIWIYNTLQLEGYVPIHLDTEYSAAGWILAYPFGYRILSSWVDTCLFIWIQNTQHLGGYYIFGYRILSSRGIKISKNSTYLNDQMHQKKVTGQNVKRNLQQGPISSRQL
jgi:hypothetical protein